MVRVGIGLYGINPSKDTVMNFENVFTLKTSISQIKEINEGESIGYSRKAIENKKRKIAVLAIGYADGLNRLLSNGNGEVMIQNQRAKIVGNVCMDMCMVDITHIDCTIDDDVFIFGKGIGIEEVAEKLKTIPYEILTSISQRVKRVYISE
jgi:alanine racemase